jgi:hypothetical protein
VKTKVHTRYKLEDGTPVPGATTVIGILDKPALINWAWKLGLEGKDYKKVRDTAASIGTIAHYLAECDIKNEKPDLSEYSPNDVDKAETAFLAWLEFKNQNHLEPIASELQLVSETHKYGGTIDLYAKLNGGGECLIDLKTSSGLWPEMRLQMAAYKNLLIEHGKTVSNVHLLRIDKETGEFNHHRIGDLSEEWEMFKHLITVYNLKQKVWKK